MKRKEVFLAAAIEMIMILREIEEGGS